MAGRGLLIMSTAIMFIVLIMKRVWKKRGRLRVLDEWSAEAVNVG